MFRTLLPVSLVVLSAVACRPASVSETKAIFETNDIKLLDPAEAAEDSGTRGVGAILDVFELDGELMTNAVCSAVRVSKRHIMTAAHCELGAGHRLVFAPHYLAEDGSPQNLRVLSLSTGIRFQFRGSLDAETQEQNWKDLPNLGASIYRNAEMDFAVFDLGYELDDNFAQLDERVYEDSALKIYGFPNGIPLSRAEDCTGKEYNGVLRHDCDALSGSSGGLIVDDQNRPVALHTFSSIANKPSPSAANGQFENQETLLLNTQQFLAAQSPEEKDRIFWECRSFSGAEKEDCQVGEGLNRATLFSSILKDLKTHNSEVYESLFQKADTEPEQNLTEHCPLQHRNTKQRVL